MTPPTMPNIRRLPLHQKHAEKGAKFGAFGQWEVPLYYTSILEEHEAVRNRAGLFDISHMGEIFFSGKAVIAFLQELLSRDIQAMTGGQALYMPLLNERGGMVDDIIVYRYSAERFLMIVNAGNVEKDFSWIAGRVPPGMIFENQSDEKGLLALQGPKSAQVLEKAFGTREFSALPYYHFKTFQSGMIARTGYTGEDGFEIMAGQKDLPRIWDQLFKAGAAEGLIPVGFGARDTLRLEAGMLLYGHDMNDDVTPLEAGIEWTLDWKKNSFIGREPLARQKEKGIKRKLVGFEMMDRGIPRQGHEIRKNHQKIGEVTSGSFSPTLQKNIGMGYVPAETALPGNEVDVFIRDKALKAKIVKLPFYRRKK